MDLFEQKKENTSLTSLIFNKLRDDILSNKYKLGSRIIEAKVAEELKVSRTPVREALKQLELDGLVDNIPNRGIIVVGITDKDVGDIRTIRIHLEKVAIRWAIERTENIADELKDIFELMEFYTIKNDIEKISELCTLFHSKIYEAADSRYLEQTLKDFQMFIKFQRNKSLKNEGRKEEALEEYKQILEGFIRKDPDFAYEKMLIHMDNARK